LEPGQIIRIRAPQKMGKTSLLYRILNLAKQKGLVTVSLNLKFGIERSDLARLEDFLPWFCRSVAQRLGQPFDSVPKTPEGCTEFLQNQILMKIEMPLVIALDRAEVLFEHPEIAESFFPLLRSWREMSVEPDIGEIWKRLRLVIVHSTKPYIYLSAATSPFGNVGYAPDLSPLQVVQVLDLAQRYELNWSRAEVDRLMTMVGGHPYLVQQALYSIWRRETTLDELLQRAATLTGIYRSHLQELSAELMRVKDLVPALARVIQEEGTDQLTDEERFRLEGLGLLPFKGEQNQISCEMYRQFFQNWLHRLSASAGR
jgi:hypothetical protein